MSTRRCTATTKAGQPCRASPLRGRNVCLAHSDADTRRSVQFLGGGPGSGRPRNPRPSEVARDLIERNVLALQRPYWRTLGYDVRIGPDGPMLVELEDGGAKMSATFEGDVRVSDYDDLAAQMAAAEKLQDRVYGRPTQATEISGPDGGPLEMDSVDTSRPEVVRSLHAFLALRPAGGAEQPDRGRR